MNSNEISLCMIVKDEEMVISRAIICANQFVDEIIIVDTGSTDRTEELASVLGAKIYHYDWCNDFSKARNFAFSKATKDYIFWMDADDYITPQNTQLIMNLKKSLKYDEVDFVSMKYSLSLDSTGNTNTSLSRNRIVKRENNYKWIGKIHEYLEVWGKNLNTNICIHHGKVKPIVDRNIKYYERMESKGDNFTLRDRLYYGNELYYSGKYEEAIIQFRIFLESDSGWVEDIKTASANLCSCYEKVGMLEEIKEIILKSFKEDIPRADLCCKLAECFFEENKISQAIYWYKHARECIPENNCMGYDFVDYYTWIPTIQLVLCYSILEKYEEAYYYNELTGIYKKNNHKVESNRQFLIEKLQEQKTAIPRFSFEINRIL